MSSINDSVRDIHDFISSLSLESPIRETENYKKYSSAYRYFHSLLIWREALVKVKKLDVKPEAFLQFEELLSDLAYTQVLLLAGMYKPARMMLRSSIENMFRVIGLELNVVDAGAKFTHELITNIKSSAISTKESPVKTDLNLIISSYHALCVYTHAASQEFLALRVPFKDLTNFDQPQFDQIIADQKSLCNNFNKLVFYIYRQHLIGLSHKNRDFILDALPKKLKKSFAD